MVMLAVYINDLLVIGTTMSRVRSVRQQLSSVFCITDQGSVLHIISMNIKYDHEAHTLSIDQSRCIKEILEKFSMSDVWTVHSPATEVINTMGPCQEDKASAKEIRLYASLVGSCKWSGA
ncbi:uncharacterized protein UBRO_04965 [Ustilago bromivora]|uniref:Reverse transcriptase Ty1/copia-type domain-containing protein n=1 Tax=Ustilago bromivora TaxID=307758 RepID=A0A1K0G5M9_9BASI|nr:uncharacterized protein UBRO_04965 [Ustilago bromivora]